MASSKKNGSTKALPEVRNAKARHDFSIEETLEAGIALCGTEVKSIRAGKCQIAGSFVRFERGEPVLYNSHIEEYAFGNLNNHNPKRPRKLLLHGKEIRKLQAALEAGGCALVPLKVYFKGGLVKVQIGLGRSKKNEDKREDLRKRTALREAERAIQAHRARH
ncbi:MAG: SsrA-binding protein [Verrucomicrobia bacterium 21-51-4]|nr:MAG: SsrA-binding protein [Verrucomicrobia bacterium 21-51-4]HQU09146.1 SsrA-binding protein SmpB [Opitutales bacterium]